MQPSSTTSSSCPPERRALVLRISLIVFLLAVISILIFVVKVQQYFVPLLNFAQEHLLAGAVICVSIYAVATVLFIPGSILTLAIGYIFRPFPIALLIVWIGASVGLLAAFVVGRYLFRALVETRIRANPKFNAIDRAVAQHGWKVVALLRLAPLVPFNLLNYALSLTSIPFWQYAIASVLCIIPGSAMYVYFGSAASDLASIAAGQADPSGNTTVTIITLVVSGVAIIAVVVVLTVIARRALRQVIPDAQPPGSPTEALLANPDLASPSDAAFAQQSPANADEPDARLRAVAVNS